MKLLVSDELSEDGLALLKSGGEIEVDYRPNVPHEELIKIIPDYEALIIRSGTKVTADVLEAGRSLKVVGRAGVGVDNVDVKAATRRGILVMNTPAANIISAAEHTMAMMLTLARNICHADASLKSGQWKRSKFTGIELNGKTLGIVGIGRVGSEVAKRAKSFQMNLIAFDPYIPPEAAVKLGVRLMPLERVLEEADIITIHAPLTPSTHHIISKDQIELMKKGAWLVNCARGGIVDEAALYEALKSKKLAGAAVDVFEEEPPTGSPLLTLDNIVVTPHLGASTKEAQEKVSVEMAESVKRFLVEKKISNAVNGGSMRLDPKVVPFIGIAEKLGSFALQLTDKPFNRIEITCHGEIASMDTKMITVSALIGILSNIMGNVNLINAESLAKEKGIQVIETKLEESIRYVNMISVRLECDGARREVRGTAFPGTEPRLLGIDEFDLDMPLEGDFILTTHADVPGVIGKIGTKLGAEGINIARMGLGRMKKGGDALLLVQIDTAGRDTNKIIRDFKSDKDFHEVRFITLNQMASKDYLL